MMAQVLIARGHEVTWWKSTFEHVSKTHYRSNCGLEKTESGLTVGWLHSRGYRNHVSLARARDHRELGKQFAHLSTQQPSPDVIVCSFPVPDLALAGVRYANRRGIPVILDIRDWWPDALIYTLPRLLRPVASVLLAPYARSVRAACRGATAITGITPPFVSWGLSQARRRATWMDRDFPHGYESPKVSDADAASARHFWNDLGVPDNGSRPTVIFIGSISRTFDFSSILSVARRSSRIQNSPTFVFCGDGDQLQSVCVKAAGLWNVVFSGRWVGPAFIQELLKRATVGLVPLPNRPDFLATVNNKTIEYLIAGVPVVVSPEYSWVAHLVREHGIGMIWNGSDPAELSQIIDNISTNPEMLLEISRKSKAYALQRFDAQVVFNAFAEYIENLTGQSVGSVIDHMLYSPES